MRARSTAIAALSVVSLTLLAACSSSSHDASSDSNGAASSPAAAASLVAAASSPAAAASSPAEAASSPAAAASSPADAPSSSPAILPEALAVADLGDGWAVDPSPGSSSGTPSCFKAAAAPLMAADHAEVSYVKGGGDPFLNELVANFPDSASTYASIVAIFDSCKQVTVTVSGTAVTGTLDPAASPNVGDASSAYTLSLTLQGTTVGYDLTVVRQGNAIALIMYGHQGTPDAQEFQTIASAAATKLPKTS
jgi:hypothetical protein